MPAPELSLREISDRIQIHDLLVRYTRAIDQKDWNLLDTCFVPDADLDYTATGGVAGKYPEVRAWLAKALAPFPITVHYITNSERVARRRPRQRAHRRLQPDVVRQPRRHASLVHRRRVLRRRAAADAGRLAPRKARRASRFPAGHAARRAADSAVDEGARGGSDRLIALDLRALVDLSYTAFVTQECQRGVIGDLSQLSELAAAAQRTLPQMAALVRAARAAQAPVIHCTAERRADSAIATLVTSEQLLATWAR